MNKVLVSVVISFLLWNCKDDCPVPPEVKDQSFTVMENSSAKTLVGTVVSSSSTAKFSIVGGDPGGAFVIDDKGAISILDSAQIDFEKTKQFDLAVKSQENGVETTATVTINVTDMGPPSTSQASYYTFQGDAKDQASGSIGKVTNVMFTPKNLNNNLAAEFDGNGYINLSAFDYAKRTISLWFQVVDLGNDLQIIYSCDNETNQFGMTILSAIQNGAGLDLLYNVSNQVNATPIKRNLWYHAVFVVDNKTFAFYLNSKKIHEETFSSYVNSYNSTLSGTVLGASRVGDRRFYGNVDDLRVFDIALTQRAVELLFYEELR